MACLHSFLLISITSLLLLFLTDLPSTTLSQNPGTSPSGPTIADCGPRLLSLAPCAPFVQRTVPLPAQPCCDNLKQLYNRQPICLCLLLNGTTLSSFPINTTLALHLPTLCNLQAISTCSGVALTPSSPASQVSFGTTTNSTVAAPPMVTVAPRPSITGFRFGRSAAVKSKTKTHLVAVVAAVAFMSMKLLS